MGRITKVILIKNAVETLGYFSEQIATELERLGYDTYFIDYDALYESLIGLHKFAKKGHTALLTFNYIGLGEEEIFKDESGHFIWEAYEARYVNILVDHPLYYHSKLISNLPHMTLFCVDREHVNYVKRFYPGIKTRFLPLAGNIKLQDELQEERFVPFGERKYDLVFTANYVPIEHLEQQFSNLDEEYATFYRGIVDDLIANPVQSLDVVMERHIREELGEVPDGDIRGAMSGMLFIDLLVRTYFRGQIIKQLAEADIKVHVFGADWDMLACRKPENIIAKSGLISSTRCVEAVRNAKIALNIMPWFKDGAHDRVFTAMLQKTVALTDDSRYLRKEFTDGEDVVFFSLEGRKYLPDIVRMLLRDEENAMRIAECGYDRAHRRHTWMERARQIAEEL